MKILHITYGFDGGGVGYVIKNYCAVEKFDGISFDIVGEDTGKRHLLQDDLEKAGFRCFYVTPKKKNLIKNMKEIYALIKSGRYDAVHVHFEEWSFLYLLIAKLCGVKIRICHAHMAHVPGASVKAHYRLFRKMIKKLATHRIACSRDAGNYLYEGLPYTVLKNAIDAESFRYSKKKREEKRKELGLQDAFVCGTVGRLSYQKDPEYTLDILYELKKRRKDAVLVFAGKGELQETVKKKAAALGIEKDVYLLGHRNDIQDLMQAFDVFVLPSRFEGLGIAYVEAQAAGLHTYASKGVVPEEAGIADDLMHYIRKEDGPAEWAAEIAKTDGKRRNTGKDIRNSGYDISTERKKLENIYNMALERDYGKGIGNTAEKLEKANRRTADKPL